MDATVSEFIESVTPAKRKRDAHTLLAMMGDLTGEEPYLCYNTIIGFGTHHYRYDSGREGDAPIAAFSPRKASSTVYLTEDTALYSDLLERLGPHTLGKVCLYITDLEKVDLDVLEQILSRSHDLVMKEINGG
jgi:hypothetical protein